MPQENDRQSDEKPPHLQSVNAASAAEEEQELWRGHPHWKDFLDLVCTALLWTLVGTIFAVMGGSTTRWGVMIVTASAWAYVVLRIAYGMLNYHYRLTTERLFVSTGVFSKTIDQLELVRVDDVRIRKSLVERIVGLGTVEIISTDASHTETILRGIEDPERLADMVRHHMRQLRQQSVYVERL
jgi:uncharacterized membrane protein YdbT with pleckstrin-like domain